MTHADSHPSQSLELPTLSSQFLLGVQQMDASSWSRLVTIFGPIVYRWCRMSGVREADAPDIVQDIFAAVARGVAQFEKQKLNGSFRSWLATITRNKVRDYYRIQAKRQAGEGGTQALARLQAIPEENLDSTICSSTAQQPVVHGILQQVEAEFEPKTWQAFWLTTIDSAKAADVAESLGLSVASVYQAKSRVLRTLRQRLAEVPQ
ncbi:MAG: sigma-70 family RNA polymerase sigma factor [Pirellulaceae bacterium]